MASQQSSRSVAPRKTISMTQPSIDLEFIFKRPIFWRPFYIAQSAWLEHIPFAYWLMATMRPGKVVELGTHYGSSYFSFCQAVANLDLQTQCYAVDTWGGDEHAGVYGEEVYQKVEEYNQQHYSSFSTLIRSTFDQALDYFPDGSIDLLHIDGLHTYEAVRHDFESWLPKLSDKAIVIMHDTNVRERGFGVFQLLDELKKQYPHFEFAHGHGLGVIGVGSEQSDELNSLYSMSENALATKQVHEIFSCLGKACSDSWENGRLKRRLAEQQQQAQEEAQQVMEQHALERGRLAERVTSQHHAIKEYKQKLKQYDAQAADFASHQQQNMALTAEVATLQQRIGEMQSALTLCEQQRDEHLTNAQSLEEKLENAQQQLHQQAVQLNEEAQRAAQLTLSLNNSNGVLDEYSRQLGALQQQIEELNQTLASAQQQHQASSQSWLEQEQNLNAAIVARDGEIKTLNNTLAQNAQTISQQRDEIAQVNSLLTASQQELSETNQSLTQRFNEIATLTLLVEERDRALDQAADKQRKLKEEYQANQQAWRTEQADMAQAHKDLQQQLLASQQQAAGQQNQFEARISELAKQVQSLNDIVEARDTEINTLNTTVSEHVQTIRQQREELKQENAQLAATQQEVAKVNQDLNQRFTEIATLTLWLEERDRALEKAANEHSKLEEAYKAHQQTWKTEQASMAQAQETLQQQLNASQQNKAALQTQLEARIGELVNHNQTLEATIAERFRELAVMTRHTEQLTRDVEQKELQLQKAKDRAQNLKQTVSWKMTAPLRALSRPFKDHTASSSAPVSNVERIAESGLFDELWYQHRYPEMADSGLSAIEHYIKIGADKGYNPSELFDTRWYLQTYIDVAQGSINPLLHYILHGKAEQRHCLPENKRK